ncbi:MAG: response regulator transcription factor, partial [Taibaiella sp.]|nr:response regulator transcription factor [Taibaiella sp.]
MNEQEILVIDDEPQICRLLEITLRSEGYKVKTVNTAKEAVIALAAHPADIVLLDIGLPDKSGQEVLKEIRQWYEKPVIVISVQNAEEDIVEALDNGADDYLVKPFRTGELLARIRTALRKSVTAEKEAVLEFGKLIIDLLGRTVKKDGNTIKLTQTEYN